MLQVHALRTKHTASICAILNHVLLVRYSSSTSMCIRDYTAATAAAARVRALRASQISPQPCIYLHNCDNSSALTCILQRPTILAAQIRFSIFAFATRTLSSHKARTIVNYIFGMCCMTRTITYRPLSSKSWPLRHWGCVVGSKP